MGQGGVWGGHGGGLSVGLKEILVYHLLPREGEAVLHQQCVQCGWCRAVEAEAEDSEEDSSITRTGNLLEVDEILPKYLKSLDVHGLSWLSPPLDWQTGMPLPLFKKGDWRLCSNPVLQHSSASPGQSTLGYWYLFIRKNVGSVLIAEHWTS